MSHYHAHHFVPNAENVGTKCRRNFLNLLYFVFNFGIIYLLPNFAYISLSMIVQTYLCNIDVCNLLEIIDLCYDETSLVVKFYFALIFYSFN